MSRPRETNRIPPTSRAGDDVSRRLAVLEEEIEEHRAWLRDEPLLRRRGNQAA